MRTLLTPVSWLYSGAMQLRMRLYRTGIFSGYQSNVPVISVGNLSVGGTGKTPLVEYLASYFLEHSYTVAVVSRGYKRASRGQVIVSRGVGPEVSVDQAGDEPYMLSVLYPNLRVVVDKSRVDAAKTAVNRLDADVIIMDDGFQHMALTRDVNIVLVPVEDILNRERVLPAGRLREPWKSLKRATHIVLTDNGNGRNWEAAERFIHKFTEGKIYRGQKRLGIEFHNPVKQENIPLVELEAFPNIIALAGIGNPEQFRMSLEGLPAHLVEFRGYADHYSYPLAEQKRVLEDFRSIGADYLVMTAKDFVKWDQDLARENPIYFLPVEFSLPAEFMKSVVDSIGLEGTEQLSF